MLSFFTSFHSLTLCIDPLHFPCLSVSSRSASSYIGYDFTDLSHFIPSSSQLYTSTLWQSSTYISLSLLYHLSTLSMYAILSSLTPQYYCQALKFEEREIQKIASRFDRFDIIFFPSTDDSHPVSNLPPALKRWCTILQLTLSHSQLQLRSLPRSSWRNS